MEGRAAGLPHGLDESIPISPIQKWRLSVNIILIPVCVLLFAVICYWSIGLNPGTDRFFRFLGVLFLAVYTAESQVRFFS